MAERDHRKHRENTDGGEAVPRPHRAFRLVNEHSGTDSGAAEIKPCRIRTTDR